MLMYFQISKMLCKILNMKYFLYSDIFWYIVHDICWPKMTLRLSISCGTLKYCGTQLSYGEAIKCLALLPLHNYRIALSSKVDPLWPQNEPLNCSAVHWDFIMFCSMHLSRKTNMRYINVPFLEMSCQKKSKLDILSLQVACDLRHTSGFIDVNILNLRLYVNDRKTQDFHAWCSG